MVNIPRIKGTGAETAVVKYLSEHGWPLAERRSLKGSQDRGDVTGMPGLAVEVKYANAGIRMGTWLAETGVERLNAKADHGILVIKPFGMGDRNTALWLAVMVGADFNALWLKALTASEFTVAVVDDPPATYSEKDLKWQLHAKARGLTDPREVIALTLRPPGTKDNPDAWYRVMTLEQMTRLLHAAGYGDGDGGRSQVAGLVPGVPGADSRAD
jgi:hypothetical protein